MSCRFTGLQIVRIDLIFPLLLIECIHSPSQMVIFTYHSPHLPAGNKGDMWRAKIARDCQYCTLQHTSRRGRGEGLRHPSILHLFAKANYTHAVGSITRFENTQSHFNNILHRVPLAPSDNHDKGIAAVKFVPWQRRKTAWRFPEGSIQSSCRWTRAREVHSQIQKFHIFLTYTKINNIHNGMMIKISGKRFQANIFCLFHNGCDKITYFFKKAFWFITSQ